MCDIIAAKFHFTFKLHFSSEDGKAERKGNTFRCRSICGPSAERAQRRTMRLPYLRQRKSFVHLFVRNKLSGGTRGRSGADEAEKITRKKEGSESGAEREGKSYEKRNAIAEQLRRAFLPFLPYIRFIIIPQLNGVLLCMRISCCN